jgi:hypothetical protein
MHGVASCKVYYSIYNGMGRFENTLITLRFADAVQNAFQLRLILTRIVNSELKAHSARAHLTLFALKPDTQLHCFRATG